VVAHHIMERFSGSDDAAAGGDCASPDWPLEPHGPVAARASSPPDALLPAASGAPADRDTQQQQQLQQPLAAAQRTARVLRGEVDRLHALLAAAAPVPGVSLQRLRELAVALAAGQVDAGDADPRDVKILDLAKKNRALMVAQHAARAAAARAATAGPALPQPPAAASPSGPRRRDDDEEEKEAARAKAATAAAGMQAALARATRERDALAADLRATQRALAAEVAPDQPLQAVLRQCGLLPPPQLPQPPPPQPPHAQAAAAASGKARLAAREAPAGVTPASSSPTQGRRAAGVVPTARTHGGGSGRAHSLSAGSRHRGGGGSGGGDVTAPPSLADGQSSLAPSASPAATDTTTGAGLADSGTNGGGATGWRGRGQTIVLLRARVRALEQQLQQAQSLQPGPAQLISSTGRGDGYQRDSLADGEDDDDALCREEDGQTFSAAAADAGGRRGAAGARNGVCVTPAAPPAHADQRAEDALASLKATRGRQLRELEAELDGVRAEGEECRRRLAGVKARAAVLEADLRAPASTWPACRRPRPRRLRRRRPG
jgi:hypothetical protein